MRIFLVRHARQESVLCNDNTSLCEIGRKQAFLLGKRLKKYGLDEIFASGLIRAVETAEIIREEAGKRDVPIKIREGLRETDFGELTGLPDSEIKIKYKEFMESRYHVEEDWAYPGGESGQEVFIRARKVLDEIIQRDKENVCVVTHGGTIRVLLAGLFGDGQKDRLLFGKYLERGGFTELYYDKKTKRCYLERFNDYAHLEADESLLMRKDK